MFAGAIINFRTLWNRASYNAFGRGQVATHPGERARNQDRQGKQAGDSQTSKQIAAPMTRAQLARPPSA